MSVSAFRRTLLTLVIAFLTSLAVLAPAFAQSRAAAIRERLKTRPSDVTLYYWLALAETAEGNRAGALEALREVRKRGRGFLPPAGVGFEPLWQDREFRSLRSALERKLPKVTAARELFRLDTALIPEGIAYDPVSRSYFVGSIATQKIVRVDSAGAVSDLSRPGDLRQVLGLAVDAERRRLHAVSTSALGAPGGEPPVNEIVTYDLDTGNRVRTVRVGGAAQLNDVAVSMPGDLFTTDSQAGAVYRIRASDGTVDTLAAPGTIPGANGLAPSGDDSGLYVAHSTGIARIDLRGGPLLPRLEIPAGESIAAIDGLYRHDGATLLGIQNATNPGRVIRIHLDGSTKVRRIETLLSHHHAAIDEPTTGVIVGRSFALLATTQVSRYAQGAIDPRVKPKAPVVLGIDLDARRN